MARRRRPKGHAQSRGYAEAKRAVAKLHMKAVRQNTHATRVWAKNVVDNHAVIAVEDFKPAFLAKSSTARETADAAIGAAKRELIERGARAGRRVVLVPPAYTTMTCSKCFSRAKVCLELSQRSFLCDTCGHTAGRDRNAARVILAMVERDRAGADDMRHLVAIPRAG
jgi:putative transposase